jgi:hypothetical protein
MDENQKELIEKLQIKNEKLEKEIEKLNARAGRFADLILIKDQWKECAHYYADKFQLAYKGYLITQGMSPNQAEESSLSVLDKIKSLE